MKRVTYIVVMLMVVSLAPAIDVTIPLSRVTRVYHTGALEDAEKVAQRRLTWESENVESRLVTAKIKAELGKFADATWLLSRNIKESPDDFRSWSLLGICHVRLGDEAEGAKCLKKALDINPYHGPALLWLAKVTTDKIEQTTLLEQVLVMEERGSQAAKEALKMLDSPKEKY